MKRLYDVWAGNPRGTQEDETRCVASVPYSRCLYQQCSRRRGHGREGLFCVQHARKNLDPHNGLGCGVATEEGK